MRQKLYFIVISGMTTRYNRASEADVHGQDIFETMIQSPNHELLTHDLSYTEIEQILKSLQLGEKKGGNGNDTSQDGGAAELTSYTEDKTKNNGRKLMS